MTDKPTLKEVQRLIDALDDSNRAVLRPWMLAHFDERGKQFRGRKVLLLTEEVEQRFVAAYDAATAAEARFDDALRSLGTLPIPGNEREKESLRRLSLFLGTLFAEGLAASVQLAVLQMPRAQYILNRQLLEYAARNQWFLQNKAMAVTDLDRLPKTVYEEVTANRGAFRDPAFVKKIEENYEEWARKNPDLDTKAHKIPGPTEMVKLSLNDVNDLFWYYGNPSLVVHGKTHAIQEVLRLQEDGTVERSPNSLGLERVDLLYHATNLAIRYGLLLAVNFALDSDPIRSLSGKLEKTMRDDGLDPLPTVVRRYL